MFKKILTFILIFSLQACTLHRSYHRPTINIPFSWRLVDNEISTEANLRWWEAFNDPVLNCYIVEALYYNWDLKFAIARVLEYYEQLRIVRADLFPAITGSGQIYRNEISVAGNQFLGVSAADPSFGSLNSVSRINNFYALALNASYELDVWGRIRSATEAALADYFAQIENRRTVVLSLVSSVASAYFLLRQYDKQLAIANQTLASRIKSYELAVVRFEEGLTSELEVKQSAAEVETARTQVKEFEISVPQQENLLSILLGRNPQSLERGLTLDEFAMPPSIPEGLPSDILEQRPDIRKAEQAMIAANARIGEARALLFPQISLTANFGTESLLLKDLFTGPARTWQYGASFLQTIFDASKTLARVDQTKVFLYEAYTQYYSAIQNAFREVDDALIAHQKLIELVEVQKQRVKVLKEYLALATLQYQNGQTDYLNVLDAERSLFDAQLEYAQAQSDSFISVVNMYKALGGGWVLDADCEALAPEYSVSTCEI